MVTISLERQLTPEQFIDLLVRSTLAERRPVENRPCIEKMLAHADLLVTAWEDQRLVGVARSVTDFAYACYLSDLAVDQDCQHRGIGTALVQSTREALDPGCNLILLSAPAATGYYPKIGFTRHPSAWISSGS